MYCMLLKASKKNLRIIDQAHSQKTLKDAESPFKQHPQQL